MERRGVTRYNLQVPAHVETVEEGGNTRVYKLKTRDISSNGAFLLTNGEEFEPGMSLKVNLYLNTFTSTGSCIVVNGRVVRCAEEGVGVCFDGQYQFVNQAPELNV
jgi:hypothetical protein